MVNIAIIGATGAVGKEILKLLEKRAFPVSNLKLFASAQSHGVRIPFRRQELTVEEISEEKLKGFDYAFFAAGRTVSQHYAPIAVQYEAVVIDLSSHFRMDPEVPLIIPEINSHALHKHSGIIASPNCTATMLLLAIAPLHRQVPVRRIVMATYQAASGAGARAMRDLEEEARAVLNQETYRREVIPFPYAFNLFVHNSPMNSDLYNDEEMKILLESRKILEAPDLLINASCVRVPTLRAHALAINAEFDGPMDCMRARAILHKSQGISLFEDLEKKQFPMPIDASGKEEVLCGRIRNDFTKENTIDLWVVGDQLLKGAALNAVQIAEQLAGRLQHQEGSLDGML